MEKTHEYAAILTAKMLEIFDKESEDQIDRKELFEGDNLTHFIHALATIMPTFIYNKLVTDTKNHLEFNHLANGLVFQYSKKED
jgi:hypothetical protein